MTDRDTFRELCLELFATGPKTCAEIGAKLGFSAKSVSGSLRAWNDPRIGSSVTFHVGQHPVRVYGFASAFKEEAKATAPADPIADAVASCISKETRRIADEEAEKARAIINNAIKAAQSNVRTRVAAMINIPGLQLDLSHIDLEAMIRSGTAPAPAVNDPELAVKKSAPTAMPTKSTADLFDANAGAAKDKERKPKLVIVGLHQNKQELIKREFRDKFDLRIFNPDQLSWIAKAINHGDNVLCLADYISHKHTECVQSAGGKMTIVRGGMSGLRAEISSIMEETKVAA
jgi:hypothetical protein